VVVLSHNNSLKYLDISMAKVEATTREALCRGLNHVGIVGGGRGKGWEEDCAAAVTTITTATTTTTTTTTHVI